ncbi:Choline/ethanolaminephosphotransferase 1 [Armadillidium nasatum]|uniref:diacylglycerol cholinephosphotransferase n=1 Tax=Armadillidium nasatum TaxID=96803 RepID=A0A5N5SH36_9CRUS|nr:Choline/ethanolaminephosphotransferase 1 [Armadillidium nasatum]
MGRQLSTDQLIRLEKHSYSCTNASLLDPIMQKLWCWLVNKCPMSLAPNLITITGLIINIITCLILIYYSPDAQHEVPRWACFLCALGLFIYQSLDAIDGKQARRTGTSSPLGELFDHGCDSLSTVFVSLSVCCAVQLGSHPNWMFFQCVMAVTLFYCAHWQTYVSGTLRFGLIDVTEAQFTVIVILLISSIFGSGFWSTRMLPSELPFKCLPTIIGSAAGLLALFNNFKVILIERGAGRNGSTVAGTSVLSPIVPLFLMVAPAILIAWKSPYGVYTHNPALYLLTFGFVAARVTNRLVVAHMTKSEMAYTDASMFGPAALFINQYFNVLVSEHILLWIVCLYVTYDLSKYCREVCLDICDHLQISLFVIDPPSKGSKRGPSPGEKNGGNVSSKYSIRSKAKGRAW